jgi:hypothetical protein
VVIRLAPWLLAGALLASALAGWQGYRMGAAAERAAHEEARRALQLELFDVADRLSEMAADLETARADRDARAKEAEADARADPDAVLRVPAADSLSRLERRWGAD